MKQSIGGKKSMFFSKLKQNAQHILMLAVTTMNDAGALKTFLGKHFRRENFQSCVISIGLNIYYDTVCSEEIWSLTTAFRR